MHRTSQRNPEFGDLNCLFEHLHSSRHLPLLVYTSVYLHRQWEALPRKDYVKGSDSLVSPHNKSSEVGQLAGG